jgi:hypothetical protein
MATYVGGSHSEVSSFYRRPSTTTTTTTTTTASSVSANMGPTPTFSKASEGLEGVPVWTFKTIKNMQNAISSYREKLEASKASPYLIFRLVTTDDLLNIERARENGKISRGVRMTHYVDWNILILKVPTAKHEATHRNFCGELVIGAAGMGLKRELIDLGATTFKTPRVSKEGDSTFKPRSIRPRKADWPTIVLESGWSESLTKLRQDAHIWLKNSRGDIKIVLLFLIGRTARTMIIEKWENRPVPANPPVPSNRPATRSMTRAAATPPNQPPQAPTQTPTQIQVIAIDSDSNTVNGAPLTLEFRKIFLRQAIPPLEHDFTFIAQDLSAFAANMWAAMQ